MFIFNCIAIIVKHARTYFYELVFKLLDVTCLNKVLYCIVLYCIVLYCIVLDWIGLDWVGLDWIGLDWVGLYWIGLDWVGLDWIGLDWIGLDCTETIYCSLLLWMTRMPKNLKL